MAKQQKLFEYAILWHPNDKQEEEGQKSKILAPPTHFLASSEKAASMTAATKIPNGYEEDLDQIEIIVRPF